MHSINMKHTLSFALLMSCIMPSVYGVTVTVTGTGDTNTAGTLRNAISLVNAAATGIINFNITGPAPFIIQPSSDLPALTKPVLIDGYSQTGTSGNTLTNGDNAVLLIVLDGTNVTTNGKTGANGLHFVPGSSGSEVRGLVINNWKLNGILVECVSTGTTGIAGVEIVGNFIGTDNSGTVAEPNRTGIGLAGSGPLQVRGTVIGIDGSPSSRNIICGSSNHQTGDAYGIIGAAICSVKNTHTTIANNYIGTDISGNTELGTSVAGITFLGETGSTIG